MSEPNVRKVTVTHINEACAIFIADPKKIKQLQRDLDDFYKDQDRPRLLEPRVSDLAVFVGESKIRRIKILSVQFSEDGKEDMLNLLCSKFQLCWHMYMTCIFRKH